VSVGERDAIEIVTTRNTGFLNPRQWVGALQEASAKDLKKLEVRTPVTSMISLHRSSFPASSEIQHRKDITRIDKADVRLLWQSCASLSVRIHRLLHRFGREELQMLRWPAPTVPTKS
jgi:hypothetical protein